MSAMGGVVGVYFFLGVGSDGSLFSGTQPLASASINIQTWQFITYLPLIFALFAFMAAAYSVWGK
jgi:hypothetical protein